MQPTRAGQRCRVIGSRMAYNNEGKSPNMGKQVVTVYLHADKAGVEQENVWRCRAVPGESLITYHGGVGSEADFLECWLEVIDEPPPPAKELKREREAET
jgi:hypothetical protein